MSRAKAKKAAQLGMDPGTASARLMKDILWDFVVKSGQGSCVKCGNPMSRETFSVEHVVPWLDDEEPVKKFFDLGNIGYSHLSCNVGDRRRERSKCPSTRRYNEYGCRCEPCKALKASSR